MCHDLAKMAKSLFIFLFFFFLSWTYYTEGSVGKCYITSITSTTVIWQEVTVSYHMMSHDRSYDRHGKVVHRPYSSCISSIENLTGTLSSSLCQRLIKSSWLNSGLELALWYYILHLPQFSCYSLYDYPVTCCDCNQCHIFCDCDMTSFPCFTFIVVIQLNKRKWK